MPLKQKRRNKYNNKKIRACKICGLPFNVDCPHGEENEHTFDSLKEHRRFQELLLLQKADQIRALEVQPIIYLHAKNPVGNSKFVGKYIADFRYYEKVPEPVEWQETYEDVKSKATLTALAKWKIKHAESEYGIKIKILH